MNIFVLDLDPAKAARYHCDKHVVKMIVEYAQLMSSAHHELGSARPGFYKKTHVNHPCAVWARQSCANYNWLHALASALCSEYTHRYGRVHKVHASGLLRALRSPPRALSSSTELTAFAQAMPDHCKGPDAVQAYRLLYAAEKLQLCRWTNRSMPYWLRSFGYTEVRLCR